MATSFSSSNPADLRMLLERYGYVVLWRHQGWHECLLQRGPERWVGVGGDETAALEDAIRRALPAHLGRELFRRALEDATAPGGGLVGPEPAAEAEPQAPGAGDSTAAAVPSVPPDAPPTPAPLLRETAEREPAPGLELAAEPEALRDPELAASSEASREPEEDDGHLANKLLPRPGRRMPSMTPGEAREEIEGLWKTLEQDRPEVACWTPLRQRLQLLSWIGYARAVQEGNDGREIRDAVREVAQELSRIAGLWWPGNVPALQVGAWPEECTPEVGPPAGERPRTWLEVAEAAQEALEWQEERDEERGADEQGWMDADALEPGHPDPHAAFEEARRILEQGTGSLHAKAQFDRQRLEEFLDPAGTARVLEVARTLRWLRGAIGDVEAWVTAMGRLRWLADRGRGSLRRELSTILDPSLTPARGWARELGMDPQKRSRARRKKRVLESCPRPDEKPAPEKVHAWLRHAFECPNLQTRRIAGLVQPFADSIVDLDPTSFSGERKHRRRLSNLIAILRGDPSELPEPAETKLETVTQGEGDDQEQPAPVSVADRLLEEILPHTQGRRAVLVTNRPDARQDDMLRETFDLQSIDHEVASNRRLEAVVDRIASGRYDIVLAATGFQSHRTDLFLKAAAQRARVPYVRANRARRLACIRALHRDLGLGGERSRSGRRTLDSTTS